MQEIHGYLELALCVVGVACSLANICVLTRSSMRSPLNVVLGTIAVVDCWELTAYAVHASYW